MKKALTLASIILMMGLVNPSHSEDHPFQIIIDPAEAGIDVPAEHYDNPNLNQVEKELLKREASISYHMNIPDKRVSLSLKGNKIGTVSRQSIPRSLSTETRRIFSDLKPIIGEASNMDFRIKEVIYNDYKRPDDSSYLIMIVQIVDELELAESVIVVRSDDSILSVDISWVSPQQPNLDQRSWIKEDQLRKYAVQALRDASGSDEFNEEWVNKNRTDMVELYEDGIVYPIIVYGYRYFIAKVNGLTGEVEVLNLIRRSSTDLNTMQAEDAFVSA